MLEAILFLTQCRIAKLNYVIPLSLISNCTDCVKPEIN
jgi:hypothetical protein